MTAAKLMHHIIFAGVLLMGCNGCVNNSVTFFALNIANGYGVGQFRTPQARAAQAALIKEQLPDVVALSEVDVGCSRSGSIDTAAAVTVLLDGGRIIFAPTMQLDGGEYGIALWLSDRLKLIDHRIKTLPTTDGQDPRNAIEITVEVGGHELVIVSTHLCASCDETLRDQQLDSLAVMRADVLLGDFNARQDVMQPRLPRLKPASPDDIDAVWARWQLNGALVATVDASDHPFAARADFYMRNK